MFSGLGGGVGVGGSGSWGGLGHQGKGVLKGKKVGNHWSKQFIDRRHPELLRKINLCIAVT